MSTNNELMQRRAHAVPRGVGQIHPIFAARAENLPGSGTWKAVNSWILLAALRY